MFGKEIRKQRIVFLIFLINFNYSFHFRIRKYLWPRVSLKIFSYQLSRVWEGREGDVREKFENVREKVWQTFSLKDSTPNFRSLAHELRLWSFAMVVISFRGNMFFLHFLD